MRYFYEATSLEGIIQQVAVAYIARGKYYFYVSGRVPVRLTPHQHDERIIRKFDVAKSKWTRYRRRLRWAASALAAPSSNPGKPTIISRTNHQPPVFLSSTNGIITRPARRSDRRCSACKDRSLPAPQ